jgi:protein ImuB
VDRTACIDLPAFPLQLLLRKHPDWRLHPAAVVEADTPQGTILWINEKARAAGIRTGMRYAAGLSLAAGLRAAVVLAADIDEAVAQLAELLRRFTPFVEPGKGEPGVFWLDAKGLERLFGSLSEWASSLHAEIVRAGYVASLAVGFDRFALYAVAKDRCGLRKGDTPLFRNKAGSEDVCKKKGSVPFSKNGGIIDRPRPSRGRCCRCKRRRRPRARPRLDVSNWRGC